jgi:hypothetical protein
MLEISQALQQMVDRATAQVAQESASHEQTLATGKLEINREKRSGTTSYTITYTTLESEA